MLGAKGVRLNLLMGKTLPLPAPRLVMEALESVEIAISDRESSGFALVFRLGRDPSAAGVQPLLQLPGTKAGSRVIVTGVIGARPTVLIDGIIRDVEVGAGDGAGTLTLMGQDLSLLMDKEARQESYPALGPTEIAASVIARYASDGVIPDTRPAVAGGRDNPVVRTPQQNGTDLAYLRELAAKNDFIFSIIPGPMPGAARAYWGPQLRVGTVQPALSVDMGPNTNTSGLSFEYRPGAAVAVRGEVLEENTGQAVPVTSITPTRPPLASSPAVHQDTAGTETLEAEAGQAPAAAMAQAQAQSDASTDVLVVKGTCDVGQYGRVLEPRKNVGLRGAGFDYDGLYYVADVLHKITKGTWSQEFTLVREGTGTTTPVVPV